MKHSSNTLTLFTGELRYSIIGGSGHQFFSVDGVSGTVTLVNLHNFGSSAPSYPLNMSVSDGVYSNNAAVQVILASANAHAPVFDKPLYEVTFAENQAAGVLVAKVTATDEDRYSQASFLTKPKKKLSLPFSKTQL